jgi:hypothetical protein
LIHEVLDMCPADCGDGNTPNNREHVHMHDLPVPINAAGPLCTSGLEPSIDHLAERDLTAARIGDDTTEPVGPGVDNPGLGVLAAGE